MKISKWRLLIIVYFVVILIGTASNIGVIDWFRTYSLDGVLINKVQKSGLDNGSLIKTNKMRSDSVNLEDPREILRLINVQNDINLKKVKHVKGNWEVVYDLYMFKQYPDHHNGYGLTLFVYEGKVHYLQIYNERNKKNPVNLYKVLNGNIELAAFEEAFQRGSRS